MGRKEDAYNNGTHALRGNPMNMTDDNVKASRDITTEEDQPIQFAGSVLGAQRHICAFFHTVDEEYPVLLPFIEHGFECGDRAFHVVDPRRREEHQRRLEAAGIMWSRPNRAVNSFD
jgi:hypothetical protein